MNKKLTTFALIYFLAVGAIGIVSISWLLSQPDTNISFNPEKEVVICWGLESSDEWGWQRAHKADRAVIFQNVHKSMQYRERPNNAECYVKGREHIKWKVYEPLIKWRKDNDST